MFYSHPMTEIVPQRFSTRVYEDRPIARDQRQRLEEYLAALDCGPLGSAARFKLVAATEESRTDLRGVGTYGTIKNPAGFIVGAVRPFGKALEDFGYLMERAILFATDIGLGTCWLGGGFTKSSFARRIAAVADEIVPAVTSTGYRTAASGSADPIRRRVGADQRLPWSSLFFAEKFGAPLSADDAGQYAGPLEMLRLGPSASNKQPWRVVKDGRAWHFFLQRTPGYRENLLARLLKVADLQRVDMGIAMCHFELAAGEAGLGGGWAVSEPDLPKPDGQTEYTVSWVA